MTGAEILLRKKTFCRYTFIFEKVNGIRKIIMQFLSLNSLKSSRNSCLRLSNFIEAFTPLAFVCANLKRYYFERRKIETPLVLHESTFDLSLNSSQVFVLKMTDRNISSVLFLRNLRCAKIASYWFPDKRTGLLTLWTGWKRLGNFSTCSRQW